MYGGPLLRPSQVNVDQGKESTVLPPPDGSAPRWGTLRMFVPHAQAFCEPLCRALGHSVTVCAPRWWALCEHLYPRLGQFVNISISHWGAL